MADKVLRSLSFPGLSDRYTIPDGLSAEAKEALLDCFEHVAWTDDQGQTYYDALYDALYPRTLTGIVASFNQTGITIYDTDTLDTLKQYLTVTAYYSDATSEAVTNYTLSGTLAAGTSTITASYGGFSDTFSVTVTHVAGTYTVTNTLTGCTNSNSSTYATEGASYSATISSSSGYTLTGATVSITMGGVDITSTAYSNGTISIASVTGALAITVTAVAVTLSSISAVYTQSGTVYATDTLDSLKSDLVVTATYSDSSTATIAAADYTLSGTLTEGSSTITVSYSGKTTTFTVTVTAADRWDYGFDNSILSSGNKDFGLTGTENYASGKNGYAYEKQSGVNAIYNVDIGSDNVPALDGDFTISFWLKSSTNKAYAFMAQKYNGSTAVSDIVRPSSLINNIPNVTSNHPSMKLTYAGVSIFYENNNLNVRLFSTDLQHALGEAYLMNGITYSDWNHFALTRSNGVIRFFVNGDILFEQSWNYDIYFPDQIAIGQGFMENSSSNAKTLNANTNTSPCWIDDLYINDSSCLFTQSFDPEQITY